MKYTELIENKEEIESQIKKDQLCYYCLGCNKLLDINFKGTRNCKYFAVGIADWQVLIREELKERGKR